jgi:hypothetical protein
MLILVGGSGEKKTLRFVAKYADACNIITFGGVDVVRDKLAVLKKHCEELGRSYDEIERTTLGNVNITLGGMSGSDVIKTCKELANAGVQQAIFNMFNVQDITPLEVFGDEIIPGVADF